MKKSLAHYTESEFNRLFLKNYFKELITRNGITYSQNVLDDMTVVLSDLFVQNFGGGNSPSRIMHFNEDIEEWLDKEIEELKI